MIELWISTVDQDWAHSTCSQSALAVAIADVDVTAIESDIVLSSAKEIPVMAHPPAKESDLTLYEFLEKGTASGKHLKLDFKEANAVLPSLKACQEYIERFQGIWLNADVLPGPGIQETSGKIDADTFIQSCVNSLPGACLSLGWYIDLGIAGPYEDSHVDQMLALLARHSLLAARIVIPVNLRLAIMTSGNRPPLLRLLESTACELLLWTGFGEPPISHQDLQSARDIYFANELENIDDEKPENNPNSRFRDRVGFDVHIAQSWPSAIKAAAAFRLYRGLRKSKATTRALLSGTKTLLLSRRLNQKPPQSSSSAPAQ